MRALIVLLLVALAPPAPAAERLAVPIVWLELQQDRPPTLSNLDPIPEDEGLAGARLGLADNAAGGRFLGHDYSLEEIVVAPGRDPAPAMARALAALPRRPGHALIDGNRVPPDFPLRATAIVKGDGRSLSVAAASIIAKVTRDRIMTALAEAHPGYGWERNMGYGVPAHQRGLKEWGVTPHHRCSFAPIRKMLGEDI